MKSRACRLSLCVFQCIAFVFVLLPGVAAAQASCYLCDSHSSCTQACLDETSGAYDVCGNWNCDRVYCGEVCTTSTPCGTNCTMTGVGAADCGQYGVCTGSGGGDSSKQCSTCNNYSRCDEPCVQSGGWSTCGVWSPCGECMPPSTYTTNYASDGSSCYTGTFTDARGGECGGNNGSPTWSDQQGWYCSYTCTLQCPNLAPS